MNLERELPQQKRAASPNKLIMMGEEGGICKSERKKTLQTVLGILLVGFSRSAQFHDQVSNHSEIDHQRKDLAGACASRELIDLNGKQGRGRDDREVFGPAFVQRQPHAFHEKNPS